MKDVELIISDACLGLVESLGDFYPKARWQRCTVHFNRNVFSHVSKAKMKEVTMMLKAIHVAEDLEAAREKASAVIAKLRKMRLQQAAQLVEEKIEETLTDYSFPSSHWRRIRTNVVGAFPDGNSALMLVATRLRHISGTK